ncbi:MAG: hypothetical protein H6Q69_2053 [Firmicutes bacterium]|nr:hypothetical protein [Bacillota bacterium]
MEKNLHLVIIHQVVAWILDNIQAIKPIKAKGMQRLWEWAGKAV